MKLSAYTVARNCSDLSDVLCGIDDLYLMIDKYTKAGKEVPSMVYLRLYRLRQAETKYRFGIQAEIIALKTIAGYTDIIVEGTGFDKYSENEQKMICVHIDKICRSLKKKAEKLECKKAAF